MARHVHGSGSVYRRKDGRFAASASFEGKRITKYGKTDKEAWSNLQKALDDLKRGKVVIGPKQTVKRYLEHWLEDSRRLKVRLSTLEQYRSILHAHLIPAFGHLQLQQLSREHIQAFYAKLHDSGMSPKRIKGIHAVLSSALKDAVRDEILTRNVALGVTLPRLKKYKGPVLTKAEGKRLIAAAQGHRLWFFILMGLTTGARGGELMALRWSDFDIENKKVHIERTVVKVNGVGYVEHEPKTESGLRDIRLPQVVLDALEEHRAYVTLVRRRAGPYWEEHNLVFPNKRGSYLDRETMLEQFRDILKEAGLRSMRFHDLRHSAATLLLAAGVNAKVVQEMLGHSDISITLGMYGHVMPDMQRDASDKMDDMFQ